MFQYVDGLNHLPLSGIYSGDSICNFNGGSLSSMGRKQKQIIELSPYEKNKSAFVQIEYYWHTVRHDQLRELPGDVKSEIERIYKEELDPKWLPNMYCKGCFFKAIKDLIYHFKL